MVWELVTKNKKGKVTHVAGVESELVVGILLLMVAFLGVIYVYLDYVLQWLKEIKSG
ncbi:MAG: hypothetical protein ABIF01_02195 [Candidatus Micrarchaeota archaeon]